MALNESTSARANPHAESPSAPNRRGLATRRLKVRRRVTPGEALRNAATPSEVVKALSRKATEFSEACFLEMGIPATLEAGRIVQRALLQDLIEVYNAAISRTIPLPEDAKEIEALAE